MRCTRTRERSRSRGGPYDQQSAVTEGSGAGASSGLPGRTSGGIATTPEVHVLYASPLSQGTPQINVQSEVEALSDAIQQAQGSVRLRVGVATTTALTELLTRARVGGQQTVLHLSAHTAPDPQSESGGRSLVLETAHGEPHVLNCARLESLLTAGPRLEGLPLVFVSSCWSAGIGELFVESGCLHVISTDKEVSDTAARAFMKQFYCALCSQQSVKDAWQSAQQLLKVDANPRLRACADHFLLFGHYNAERRTLWGMAGELPLRERPVPHGPDAATDQESTVGSLVQVDPMMPSVFETCNLPPRVEDFVGYGARICEVLRYFDMGRRACVISGPPGVGKSALAVELAHFASAPGRLFSRGVLFAAFGRSAEVTRAQVSIEECLRSALPESMNMEGEAVPRLCSAFKELERRRGRQLLVIDDADGALKSVEARRLLSGLLETTKSLCIAAFSRECNTNDLGSFKCVNVPVRGLVPVESADLFLKRIHRPLHPGDFERGARGSAVLCSKEVLLSRLAAHPIMQQLGGNPGDLRSASQRVTPGLRSLFDLCSAAAAAAPPRSPSAIAAGGSLQLQRMMSVDEGSGAGTELARKMSVDDGSQPQGISRLMSIDE